MRKIFLLLVVTAMAIVVWALWPRLTHDATWRTDDMNGRDVTFLVVPLSDAAWRWELHNDPTNSQSVQNWRQSLGADIVFNAGYFGEDNMASGFLQLHDAASVVPWPTAEAQRDPVSYSFMLEVRDDGLTMHYLPDDPQDAPHSAALLSFPTLVAHGAPMVAEDSGLHAARTMVAEDASGNDYLIITENDVTLYEAAQWLAAQPEHFIIAGNLDGGPSTGVSMESGVWDVDEHSAAVPSVVAGFVASTP